MEALEIKIESEKRFNKLMDDCRVFWAFNEDQFNEGIAKNLKEGEKLVRVPHGGFMPSCMVDTFLKGNAEIKAWEKAERKQAKGQDQEIIYQLGNYECYYTYDLTPVYELFAGVYSKERIKKVFNKSIKSQVLTD